MPSSRSTGGSPTPRRVSRPAGLATPSSRASTSRGAASSYRTTSIPIGVMLVLPVILVMLVKRLFGGGTRRVDDRDLHGLRRDLCRPHRRGYLATWSRHGSLCAVGAAPKLTNASRRRNDDVIRSARSTPRSRAAGMLSRIKRRQLLRIGFLAGTLLALTEFSAAILPFLWVLKIEGLGAKIPARQQERHPREIPGEQGRAAAQPAGSVLPHPRTWRDRRGVRQVHAPRLHRSVHQERRAVPLSLPRVAV